MSGSEFSGKKVTVMGLGLHGGGLASARYLCAQGAEVTVTDLRSESELRGSLDQLGGLPLRLVLGRHEERDFRYADVVVKNPAVARGSAYLAMARCIETEISLFLRNCTAQVVAVTGTKGKSTTAAAIHHILTHLGARSHLGGNIAVSPLAFLPGLHAQHYVVLELSSFQLGDLRLVAGGEQLLQPRVAIITNLMSDHMDYYASFEDYFGDKALVFSGQSAADVTLYNQDDRYGPRYAALTPAQPIGLSHSPLNRLSDAADGNANRAAAWLEHDCGRLRRQSGAAELILPEAVTLVGEHNRFNLLFAATAVRCLGFAAAEIAAAAKSFGGVAHRMQKVASIDQVDFYNDSAATIAEAALAALESFTQPVHLIAGGSDKRLDLSLFRQIAARSRALYLLSGNATDRIVTLLQSSATPCYGPFDTLAAAVTAARRNAQRGEAVVLSPGCASFGMFRNEFHRGDSFCEIVHNIAPAASSGAPTTGGNNDAAHN